MELGTVKRFDDTRGWGFIDVDDNPTNAFVHWSEILSDGYKTINAGDRVSFNLVKSEKGLSAESVYVINEG
jgi:CspA family cold shock protein